MHEEILFYVSRTGHSQALDARENRVNIRSNWECVVDTDGSPLISLLAAVSRGDRTAFQRLYASTSSRMMGICMRLLQDRARAEDAMQEAYIRVWHSAGEYHEARGTPLTWMMTIARYQCIDMLRKNHGNTLSIDDMHDDLSELVDAEHGDDGGLALDGCMQQLSAEQRSSILMSFYYGMTHEQLSASLQKPLGTVKSWLRRGLLSLKQCLSQ